jgi:hypothetical protein
MTGYDTYPAVDSDGNFPPSIRAALMGSAELKAGVAAALATDATPANAAAAAAQTAVTANLAGRNIPIVLIDNAVAPYNVDVNTLALYHLENAYTDASANAYALTPGPTTPVFSAAAAKFGSYGLASGFAYMPLAVEKAATNAPLPDFTIEGWIKTSATALMVAMGKSQAVWFGSNGDGSVYAGVEITMSNAAGHGTLFLGDSTVKVNDGNWHNVVLAVKGGAGVSLYCDQKLVASTTAVAMNYAGQSTAYSIGGMGSAYAWTGQIDEVRVSNSARFGGNAYPARPTTLLPGLVTYVGRTSPTDMLKGDVWRKLTS